jgi:hypothetical protein
MFPPLGATRLTAARRRKEAHRLTVGIPIILMIVSLRETLMRETRPCFDGIT